MKYSQLVHMPRDVKHWFEEQLKAYGIDGVVYTKYLLSLLQEETLEKSPACMHPVLDSKKKNAIESLLEQLYIKLKDFESRDTSCFIPTECKTNSFEMDPISGFSNKPNNDINCMEPVQPCLSLKSNWTQGLLHDSTSENNKQKMEDYFSALFYDSSADVFGLDFAWNKSDERKNGYDNETDRINFYNKQNLLASECSERLYERNADIDRLIAKFDANIEDIWKTTSESDHLKGMKYQTLLSQNFFSNPYVHYGSNVIWSLEQNEGDEKVSTENKEENITNYKSSFSHWNKFSSPVLTNSNSGFDTMLSAFNLTLSNIQKWSALDGYNNGSNALTHHNKNESCFTEITSTSFGNEFIQGGSLGYVPVSNQHVQEEEDLLTSARTHFRPIRVEEPGGSQTGIYADGTTFVISNDLDKVAFKRSESGALYLEADAHTPRKYMEFKEKEGATNKCDSESDVSSIEEFVPKFRVRQSNEKYCQTDEIDTEQMVPSMNNTDCESDPYESEEDEFYFPGDDELAQKIINTIEEESKVENEKINLDCNLDNDFGDTQDTKMDILEMSLYKMPHLNECICTNGKDWNRKLVDDLNGKQEWSEIWNSQEICNNCKINSDKLSTNDKFRFREELTQEGEQLLLDLSCLQQIYSNSDWCDDDTVITSDLNDEEVQNVVEDVPYDGLISFETDHLAKGSWWRMLIAKNEPVKNSFDLSCLWKGEKFLSNVFENDKNKLNEINERPFIADTIQTERKRRNSSSQRACNLYLEGQCRRPHCRFAHCDSAIPCPFFADASCMKGESCHLSHGARRPLSL